MTDPGEERQWVVRPLIWWATELDDGRYGFDHNVSIVRISSEVFENINHAIVHIPGGVLTHGWTEWALLMPEISHPHSDRFLHPAHRGWAEAFLLTLNLVKSTEAIAPVYFGAELDPTSGALVDVVPCDAYPDADYDPQTAHWAACFGDADLLLARALWPRVVRAIGLPLWMFLIDVESKHSEPRRGPDGQVSGVSYPNTLLTRFQRMSSMETATRTRLARALMLFEVGSRLPLLPAFLMMCVVLECLFVIEDEKEVGERDSDTNGRPDPKFRRPSTVVARRVAGLLTRPESLLPHGDVRDLRHRMQDVYRVRNRVVHGIGLIDAVDEGIRKDPFFLARRCLLEILLNDGLLSAFTSAESADNARGSGAGLLPLLLGLERSGC